MIALSSSAAISTAAEARQKVERNKAATHKTWKAMHEAEAAIAKAEKGIEEARAEHGAVLADAATADEDDPPPLSGMVRLARQSHADAVDELAALKSARDRLRRELPDLESDVRTAEAMVDAAISEILAPIAADLISRLETVICDAMPYRSLLAGLIDSHADRIVGHAGRRPIEAELDAARKLTWVYSIGELTVSSAPWAAARAL